MSRKMISIFLTLTVLTFIFCPYIRSIIIEFLFGITNFIANDVGLSKKSWYNWYLAHKQLCIIFALKFNLWCLKITIVKLTVLTKMSVLFYKLHHLYAVWCVKIMFIKLITLKKMSILFYKLCHAYAMWSLKIIIIKSIILTKISVLFYKLCHIYAMWSLKIIIIKLIISAKIWFVFYKLYYFYAICNYYFFMVFYFFFWPLIELCIFCLDTITDALLSFFNSLSKFNFSLKSPYTIVLLTIVISTVLEIRKISFFFKNKIKKNKRKNNNLVLFFKNFMFFKKKK